MIADVGDICHFLPKFHPEMNPIKFLWGWAKQYFHECSNGNFKMAQKLWQEALNSCLLLTIHRFFHCAARYMSVYKLGATGVVAEYVVKNYHSHHAVQQKELETTEAEWNRRAKSMATASLK
jgi:hypothetical protein